MSLDNFDVLIFIISIYSFLQQHLSLGQSLAPVHTQALSQERKARAVLSNADLHSANNSWENISPNKEIIPLPYFDVWRFYCMDY